MVKLTRFGTGAKRMLAAILCASMVLSTEVVTTFAAEDITASEEAVAVDEVGAEDEAASEDTYVDTASEEDYADHSEDKAYEDASVSEASDETSDNVDAQIEETAEEEAVELSAVEEEEVSEEAVGSLSAQEENADVIVNTEDATGTEAGNTEMNLNNVSGNTVSRGSVGYEHTNDFPAPEKAKAVLTKKNQVKVSWKSVKKATGYKVYRMKADGTVDLNSGLDVGKKKNFTDTFDTASLESVPTLAYMIVACGVDSYGQSGSGYPAYAVASPIITDVERTITDDDLIGLDVRFTKIRGASSYTLRKSTTRSKNSFTEPVTVSANELEKINADHQIGPYTSGGKIKSTTGATIDRTYITDSEGLISGKYYYYQVKTEFELADGWKIESEPSAIAQGRVTTRAPKLRSVSANSGTKIYAVWEDMEQSTDKDGNQLINSNDFYQIYLSKNGGKFKPYAKIKASSQKLDSVRETKTKKVWLTADEAKEAGLGTTAGYYDVGETNYFVGYELEELTPMVNYEIKIAVVKNKITGSMSEIGAARTELNDIYGVRVKGTNMTTATLNWEEVEGATGYRIHYREITSKQFADKSTWGLGPWDKQITVTVEADKDGICEYEITKLTNLRYYAFYVEPVYKKIEHDSGKNRAYVAAKTRIAAPDAEVEQSGYKATSNISLKFTWPKVDKATGYQVKYYVGTTDLTVLDSSLVKSQTLKKTATSFKVDGVSMGEPVAIRITTMHETSGNTGDDAIGNSYEVIEYACPKEVVVTDGRFNNAYNVGAQLSMTMETTEPMDYVRGIRVLRSSKKTKDYEVISDFSSADGSTFTYRDSKENKDGKKIYYRIYSVLKSTKNSDWVAVSRDYTQYMYCLPTSVDDSDISVAVDETKTYTLKFKPNATTAMHVKSWEVSDDKTDSFTKGYEEKNDYIKIKSKAYKAVGTDDKKREVEDYSSYEVDITGKKKGKCYIQATLANGLVATIKVKITDKKSEDKDDDDDDKDKDKKGNGTIICLDPGHGGNDGGCAYGNLKESELNLKIAKKTKKILEKNGFEVVLTRSDDSYVDLDKRVQIAKKAKAKAIISQHINSGSAKGVECYYSIDGTGKSLASKMCSLTAKETGMSNRGAKTKESGTTAGKDYYAIIRYARSTDDGGAITGLIMENGFIQKDYDYMDSDDDLEKIAKANAAAIIDYYGD